MDVVAYGTEGEMCQKCRFALLEDDDYGTAEGSGVYNMGDDSDEPISLFLSSLF